jgi:hypothetical protein
VAGVGLQIMLSTFSISPAHVVLSDLHGSNPTRECFADIFCMLRDSIAIVASH